MLGHLFELCDLSGTLFPLSSPFLDLWPKNWDFIYLALPCTSLKCTHVLSQEAEKQRERKRSFIPILLDHISSQWRSFLPLPQNFTWLHVPSPPLPIMPEDPVLLFKYKLKGFSWNSFCLPRSILWGS